MKRLVLSAVLAAGILSNALARGETIVAGGGDAYSPFHFIADGEARGFDVDLLRAVCRTVDLDCEIRLEPWRDVRTGLAEGSIQVHVGMTRSPERSRRYRFTSPHLDQQYRVFVRTDRGDIADESDLAGKRIIVQSKGVMERLVVERGYTSSPIVAGSARESLRMLAAGEGDACLISELRGLHVARDLGLDNLERVGKPVHRTFYGFAVAPGREDLVVRLNQGLAIVKASGEYDRLYDRWFGVLEPRGPSVTDYARWAAIVALPLLAAVLLALLWSWSLRRQVALQTAALERARDLAELASEAKSRFLAAMSHEIRTPLNGVIGMSHLLMGSGLNEDQTDQVMTIRKSAQALQEIITDILDFSRIEAGERALETIPFAPAVVAGDALDIIRPLAVRKGIELRCTGLSDLPPALTGDPTAFKQVLLNLLGNAVKFTTEGFVHLDLETVSRLDGWSGLTIRVEDTGIGIDPGHADDLFGAFTQADSSTTRRFGGTGLGLAICRHLVELMDGVIGADARPGGGSVFSFQVVLPPGILAARDIGEDAGRDTGDDAPPTAEGEPAPWSAEGLKVLLVEDNAINQRVMSLLLKRFGMETVLAENGEEAVAAWRCEAFDVVLMDCQMPVMDGFEATAMLRRLEKGDPRPRTPIIALTAGAFKSDRDRCLASGMDDYLTKPVDSELLLKTLARNVPTGQPVPAG